MNPNAKSVINSNNLRQTYSAINEEKDEIRLDTAKLALLEDYYFDARYPGDNFINVSKDEFEIAYLALIDVLNEVNKWRVMHNLEIVTPPKALKTKQVLLHECGVVSAPSQDDTDNIIK